MNKRDLKQEVFNELRARILDARILPGVRISDQAISRELGTSRTPVREALIRLADHGLVQTVHNRGFTVRQFSVKDVRDIYTVRKALEVLAIELTAQRWNDEISARLKGLLDGYPELIESGSGESFNRADERFHLLIARFSDNALLIRQLNSLHDQFAILRRYAHLLAHGRRRHYEQDTYREHCTIYESLANGKLPQARQAMAGHITASMDSVIEALQSRGKIDG